MKTEIDLAIF